MIKSILMVLLLGAGFGFFSARVIWLYRIMKSVSGTSGTRADRVGQRIKLLFTDVLGQRHVRQKTLPGWAHLFIFFGFLAVQPHSLELMIKGIFPGFGVEHWLPRVYGAYLFIADPLAFLVLFGLLFALYRRLVVKPAYLTDKLDARLILLFTAVIIVTFHLINAFQLVLPPGDSGFDHARYFTVSAVFSKVFGLSALTIAGKRLGYDICYWIHILTILGFLIYIPYSKHLHLLAAVPNIFLKPLDLPKAMMKTDLEDETAEHFGLVDIYDLNWKNVLDLYACTECGRCEEQCPASMTDKPLSPKRVVSDVKHALLGQADRLLSEAPSDFDPLVTDGSPIHGNVIWSCTTCRACETVCPVEIQHLDLLLEMRKSQVLMESAFPPELQETFMNFENQSNPWGFGSDSRGDWCAGMDVPLMMDHPDADILYYVGCAGSFDDRGKQISKAMVDVLKKADVDFAILGPEERCNGDMARRAGNEYLAQTMIFENIEVLRQYRPKTILTHCPHCFNSFKNEYPRFGAEYKTVHHSQFLLKLIREKRLTLDRTANERFTFHDSCYLGRWNGLYDTPRELIRELGLSDRFMEMKRIKASGLCCGAGGTRMFMEEHIGTRINHERATEVAETGAALVAAACPYCITMLRDGLADLEADVAVQDIAEIISRMTS